MISVKQIDVQDLKHRLDKKEKFILVDCREPSEYEQARIEGSLLIPLSQFATIAKEKLHIEDDIVIHCHHGGRSQRACEYLKSQGYANVANLKGGIDAWSLEIDSEVERY